MKRPVYVRGFATWTGAGATLNAAPSPSSLSPPGLGPWPEAPALKSVHPRGRKPPAAVASLVQLASELIAACERPSADSPLDPQWTLDRSRLGIALGSQSGCAAEDVGFLEGLAARGAAFGSPSGFVYTLTSAAPAEVSLALGSWGPVWTTSAGATSGLAAVASAASAVAEGRCDSCLCGGVELASLPGRDLVRFETREGIVLLLLAGTAPRGRPLLRSWKSGWDPVRGLAGSSLRPLLGLVAALAGGPKMGDAGVVSTSQEGHWTRVETRTAP